MTIASFRAIFAKALDVSDHSAVSVHCFVSVSGMLAKASKLLIHSQRSLVDIAPIFFQTGFVPVFPL
jgi:hypothetical protein